MSTIRSARSPTSHARSRAERRIVDVNHFPLRHSYWSSLAHSSERGAALDGRGEVRVIIGVLARARQVKALSIARFA